jgi:hypothetical protein
MKPQLENALMATWQGGFSGFGDELRDQINIAVGNLDPIPLPFVPDPDIFNNALRDILDGQIPDTRG